MKLKTVVVLSIITIVVMLGWAEVNKRAALYRLVPPCSAPVITEWKPLYPTFGAFFSGEPDSYTPIYRCPTSS